MLKYGFTGNQCIIHIIGWTTAEETIETLKELFASPRWKPGKMDIVGMTTQEKIEWDVLKIKKVVNTIALGKPRNLAIVAWTEEGKVNAETVIPLLEMYGTSAKYFSDLQELFDWLERKT
jgi:hypothetical protein